MATEPTAQPGTVMLTGASGFIGSRLRDALLDDGYDVVALTRPGSPDPSRGRARAVTYDQPESLEQAIREERPELIFHLAGATKGVSLDDFRRGNLMPTRNLLEATHKVHPGVHRFVHVSSLAAFGPATSSEPKAEDHARAPVEHYGQSKLEAEEAVETMGTRLPWTIIRPPTVYGPGDVDNLELFRLTARRLNVFYGNRERFMSAIYVDDLVRGIRQAATHPAAAGEGYFLCDGTPRTWGHYQAHIVGASGKRCLELNLPEFLVDVAASLGELRTRMDGKPRLFNRQKALMGKQEAWTCTSARARADFGFNHEIDVAEGAERTLAWYRDNRWL